MLTLKSYLDRAGRPIRLVHFTATMRPRTPYSRAQSLVLRPTRDAYPYTAHGNDRADL